MPISSATVASSDKANTQRLHITAGAILLTTISLLIPFMVRGNIVGHDFTFHLQLWLEAARQWRQGTFYPHWAADAAFGHGDPRFMFYPPLSWMVGGLLTMLLPISVAPLAFIFLTLMVAGLAAYLAVLEISEARIATWAGVLYIANPYHALILYRRSDYSELMASAIFPFAVLWLWRSLGERPRALAGFAICVCALWLANLPAALIATYVLVLMLITFMARGELRNATRASIALVLGIGAAAFFLVPAAYEQRWVAIAAVLNGESHPAVNFLFAPWAVWMRDPSWWYKFNLLISLVASATICLGALGWLLSEPMRVRFPRIATTLCVAGCWCAAMMFPISGHLWAVLPKLQFVQFPWRFLLPLEFVVTVFIALARVPQHWKVLAFIPTLAVIAVVGSYATTWDGDKVAQQTLVSYTGGYNSPPEYVPLAAQYRSDPDRVPVFSFDAPKAKATVLQWSAERAVVTVDSPVEANLTLRRTWYPAWRVQVDGRDVVPTHNARGDIVLRTPNGSHRVEVSFAKTSDQRAGQFISIASLVCLALLAFNPSALKFAHTLR
jgi:6-pyruvoyl-tetrahydropterin synthase related domain